MKPVTGLVFSGYSKHASKDPLPSIDERLDRLRHELNTLRAEWSEWDAPKPTATPATRPATAPAASRQDESQQVLLYMESFCTRKMRQELKHGPVKRRSPKQRDAALGAVQSDWRPSNPPGQHPIGYRGLSMSSAFRSSPAYTIRQSMALSRNVDPYAADDTPGPGAYNTEVY